MAENAFAAGRKVEQRSLAILMPFIQAQSYNGQFVLTQKGRLARELQRSVGDALLNLDSESVWSMELKAEEENNHGNLFLETWSNRSRFTIGWMFSLNADLLGYHFLSQDELWISNFQKLKRWAFHDQRIYRFAERQQNKYDQRNDTWGRCVPIKILVNEIGMRCYQASTGEQLDAREIAGVQQTELNI